MDTEHLGARRTEKARLGEEMGKLTAPLCEELFGAEGGGCRVRASSIQRSCLKFQLSCTHTDYIPSICCPAKDQLGEEV